MEWIRGHTIGRGSSATVFLASRSNDIFAAKSVELSRSEFLQREQKILSSLSSPYIVSYKGYDITRENNKMMYNLFMEYVPGGTLSDTIQKQGGRLDESMMAAYTRQIVQGLEYLHSNGLVHCDIKGSNILIGEDGAQIADLGCVKRVDLTVEAVSGTPIYMAPEVAKREEQGFPADVWALGCTVIEMATGGSPWPNATDPLSVLYRIAYSEDLPECPEFLSYQTKDFLSKCLRRDPKQRWTASQLLEHPFLGEFLYDQTKEILEFNSNTPTSILDQGFWNTMEGSRSQSNLIQTAASSSAGNSLAGRMWQLAMFSGLPSWSLDGDSWITVRSNYSSCVQAEDNKICGSMTDSLNHGMEELESPVFSGRTCRVNIKDSVDIVILGDLYLKRCRDNLLLHSMNSIL